MATERGEPWVGILSMDIDPENLHQGAFELDWNDKFVANLIRAGYQGKPTDTDSEIVDRWFRTIVYQMLDEEGMDTDRGAGYINVVPISKGKSSVS